MCLEYKHIYELTTSVKQAVVPQAQVPSQIPVGSWVLQRKPNKTTSAGGASWLCTLAALLSPRLTACRCW